MNLLINDVLVKIIVAPYVGNKGYIMIALIMDDSEKAKAVHVEIAKKIRTVYKAVMDDSSFLDEGEVAKFTISINDESINVRKSREDRPYVRLLECEPLRFIDMLRMLGFSVVQKVIL